MTFLPLKPIASTIALYFLLALSLHGHAEVVELPKCQQALTGIPQVTISDTAINHIINGEFVDKQDPQDRNIVQKVLKGGLHFFEGAKAFLEIRKNISFFLNRDWQQLKNPKNQDNWYYSRQTENGIIYLRLPKNAFHTRSLKNLQKIETYKKGGFLWKTLFPKNFRREDIGQIITSLLAKADRVDQSRTGFILEANVPYPLPDNENNQIRVRAHINQDFELQTLYPTWHQPETHNHPFDLRDTVALLVNSQTFDILDAKLFDFPSIPQVNSNDGILSFFVQTSRSRQQMRDGKTESEKKHWEGLRRLARNFNDEQITTLINFLSSPNLAVSPGQSEAKTPEIRKNFLNYLGVNWRVSENEAIALAELGHKYSDLIYLLIHYDQLHKTDHALNTGLYLMKIRTRTPGISDILKAKRLFTMVSYAIFHSTNKDAIALFFEALDNSPCKSIYLTDFHIHVPRKKLASKLNFKLAEDFLVDDAPSDSAVSRNFMEFRFAVKTQLFNLGERLVSTKIYPEYNKADRRSLVSIWIKYSPDASNDLNFQIFSFSPFEIIGADRIIWTFLKAINENTGWTKPATNAYYDLTKLYLELLELQLKDIDENIEYLTNHLDRFDEDEGAHINYDYYLTWTGSTILRSYLLSHGFMSASLSLTNPNFKRLPPPAKWIYNRVNLDPDYYDRKFKEIVPEKIYQKFVTEQEYGYISGKDRKIRRKVQKSISRNK